MKCSIEPPPTLTGDAKKDIQNMHEYQNKLYRELTNIMNSNIGLENMTTSIQNSINNIDNINNKIRANLSS